MEQFYEIDKTHNLKKGLYMINKQGDIYSKSVGRVMKVGQDRDGYVCLRLRNVNDGYSNFSVHRLLMQTFKYKEGCEDLTVNHINGQKLDNDLSNLEWMTASENIKHAHETKLTNNVGESHPNSKLTTEDVVTIKKRLKNGDSGSQIAREYGVQRGAISKINCGHTWAHVTID